jgi:predicted hotdog family 3-hydroxylacyl-ACP dehydratase
MTIDHSDIEELTPHKGAMCLLDRVLAWDARTIRLSTRTHTDIANPLRSAAGLRAIHLCEYGAQAMAVHGALVTRAQRQNSQIKPGMLASLRAVKLHCEFIHDLSSELIVEAECIHAGDPLLQYGFRVFHNEVLLAEGRATVVLQTSG